ncbi:ABC transporter substrate-binding protein [Faecalispora anaeroviscerum]|uniref:ABC transporter substrate-binding protein n=1 Tax=Faecalispora anaeroviscerum TaxID=2991836 RepID=UPI0024BB909E|nr:ABC transporter substrate-binding protein [Faecalispora anaeroviscerum]
MNEYFKLIDTVYDITEKHPEAIELLAAHGFDQLKNDLMRKTLGKTISLETALRSKKINPELFEQKLVDVIEQGRYAVSTGLTAMKKESGAEIRVEGVLPCPIRIPLLERLEAWLKENDELAARTDYDLKAASMGLDSAKERVLAADGSPEKLSDLYLSAGFDLFFDRQLMGRYREEGVFQDLSGLPRLNPDFENQRINLRDPLGQYTIIGVVACVFMVNTAVLGDRPFPTGWEDLLRPEFENSISLPVRDLDMFNALTLHIRRFYGKEGIEKLGRNLLSGMHPAQMVKSGRQQQAPAVSITPYFFTQMLDVNSPLVPVWPKEGAIISPIFLLTKAASKDKVKPFVDFLFSKEVGELMSLNGKFPSTNPLVNNGLRPDQHFLWLGWDYIHENDIGALIRETERDFYAAAGKEQL